MEIVVIFLIVFVVYVVSSSIDSSIDSANKVDITFEKMCETSNVITITSWIGGTHATDENGNTIRVERSFPSLISKSSRYGLYPSAIDSEGGMMTLVKTKKN